MRFVVPVRTLHAGPNPKYFGQQKGVTWYNLLSDQLTGLNASVVPGTLRDSLGAAGRGARDKRSCNRPKS